MNPRRFLAAAGLFSTLLAAPLARADFIPEPEDACHEVGDPCKIDGNKGVCRNLYDERNKREILACNTREKPYDPVASSTPSAKEDVSTSSGCGVSDRDGSLGFGLAAVVGGVAVALLAVRRRRAR